MVMSGWRPLQKSLAMDKAFSSEVVPRLIKKVAEAPIFLDIYVGKYKKLKLVVCTFLIGFY